MPHSETMDRLLRRSMTAESAPTLSPEFEQRLANRLRPRRLSPKSRYFLLGYSLVGISVSLWTMHASGMDGRLAALSVLVPLVIVGAILRLYFRLPKARPSMVSRVKF